MPRQSNKHTPSFSSKLTNQNQVPDHTTAVVRFTINSCGGGTGNSSSNNVTWEWKERNLMATWEQHEPVTLHLCARGRVSNSLSQWALQCVENKLRTLTHKHDPDITVRCTKMIWQISLTDVHRRDRPIRILCPCVTSPPPFGWQQAL